MSPRPLPPPPSSPAPAVDRRSARRRRRPLVVAVVAVLVCASLAGLLAVRASGPADPTDRVAAPSPSTSALEAAPAAAGPAATAPQAGGPLRLDVDPALRPAVAEVDPIEGSAHRRAVGALAEDDGSQTDLVLDEVVLTAADDAELASFLARWDGEVLDSFAPDADGQDHLVRVDASLADTEGLAARLEQVDPETTGHLRASGDDVLGLLAVAADEWARGTRLTLDWLNQPQGIPEGTAYESPDITKNAFEWSFLRAGGTMDIGVAPAWRLLDAHGRLDERVEIMVFDGGFSSNADVPDVAKIRKASWGETNPHPCSGGSECPYHGSDVVLAAMGQVDNGYGTAGPAGPVGELLAVGNSLDYWSGVRRMEGIVEDERPDILNMSFGHDTKAGRAHASYWSDKRFGNMASHGVLLIAASGNAGRNVDSDRIYLPCESRHVLCVGAQDKNSTERADYSNYGVGDSPTSVELYAPGTVKTINDHNRSYLDHTTRDVSGTSVASPFVAGVAALVMAADPTLTAGEVRAILNETAHVGGLGDEVTGSQRRVNALAAVAAALDVEVGGPDVQVHSPAPGSEHGVTDWVDLDADAVDYAGRSVPVTWTSDVDGALGTGDTSRELSMGTHVLTAAATDDRGETTTVQVTVAVVDTPPQLAVIFPTPGATFTSGKKIDLSATSLDPDTWSAVPEGAVAWEVFRGGALVHTTAGHEAFLPAAKASPGDYTAVVSAGGATHQVAFTLEAPVPGQTDPVAAIAIPSETLHLSAYNGTPQLIDFSGLASDAEDGILSGTRFRWTAVSQHGTRGLCTGSAVPTGGIGGVVLPKDCSSFSTELDLAGGLNTTKWTVMLEAFDSTGRVAVDTVAVYVHYVTG